MKIGISCDTNNQTYDIPDFWNIEFGDKEALVITIYNDDGVAIYTQVCNRLIYAIRRVNTENNFIESLYFVS